MELSATPRTVRLGREGAVLRVALDRPDRENAINGDVIAELGAALDEAERTPECRIVVLEGADGVFCTGMDVADAAAAGGVGEQGGEAFMGLLRRLTTVPRAVVSVVDGRVAGGGVGLAAASDFVYATPRSTFGLPEALWGLLPCCVLPFLIRRTGFQPASAMALGTLPVGAERARELHLVDEVAEDPERLVRLLRARLTKVDPRTIGDLKRYLRSMWFVTEETERVAVEELGRLMASPAVRDGIERFSARRVFPWEAR